MVTIKKRMNKRKIVVSNDCNVAQSVEVICGGFGKNALCGLLESLKLKNKSRIEISHINNKIYYIKNKEKECLVEIPEAITTIGLIVALEYLVKNSKLCEKCSLFGKVDSCLKHLFV